MQDKYVGRILELVEYLDPTQAAMVAGKILEFHGVERASVRLLLGELSQPNRDLFLSNVQAVVGQGVSR